jgi:hypothetical protein
MNEKAIASFSIQPFEGTFALTPAVNHTPLTEMIAKFELEQHFEPAGGYGGLVPRWFNYGSLDRYFLGDVDQNSYFARIGGIYLLGCQCGEVGCWPLMARIRVDPESVVWDSFQQPHRPERNYSCFGPFVFDAEQYRAAVAVLRAEFSARVPAAE